LQSNLQGFFLFCQRISCCENFLYSTGEFRVARFFLITPENFAGEILFLVSIGKMNR
jgi:hypothetical protein